MKLKAVLRDARLLCDVLELCKTTQQTCTLCLQAGTVRVFSAAETAEAAQIWAECRTSSIFRDFRCQSPYNDSLVCDILDVRHLCHVLKCADRLTPENGYEREVRLSKGSTGPLLKMSFRSQRGLKSERYDILIRLRSQKEIEEMCVPALDDANSVHVLVPNMSELSHFVDNVHSARCENITFEAREIPCTPGDRGARKSTRGHAPQYASLDVEASHEYASLCLHYKKVKRTPPPGYDDEGDDEGQDVGEGGRGSTSTPSRQEKQAGVSRVTLPLRKFAPFAVAVRNVEPTMVSMHLVDEKALVLCFCHARAANVAAYIPGLLPQAF